MAHSPDAIEREIGEIRDDLTDVANELDARIAAAREKLSARYVWRHHKAVVGLVLTGVFAFFGIVRYLRQRKYEKICAACTRAHRHY